MNTPTPVWRVRIISIDGGVLERTWMEEFFFDAERAEKRHQQLLEEAEAQGPTAYKKTVEDVGGVVGYCNWRFGLMLALDKIEVK